MSLPVVEQRLLRVDSEGLELQPPVANWKRHATTPMGGVMRDF